jgi:predicted nuclease of predicted toxin-antitoxin system
LKIALLSFLMKLLLDQGLPRSTASLLRDAGIDAVHTGEIGCSTAEDAVILEQARQEDRIVVTLDADFHMLLALSGASWPSVVRIRIEQLRAEAMAELVQRILSEWSDELTAGYVLTVQPGRIRFRRLPLLSSLE